MEKISSSDLKSAEEVAPPNPLGLVAASVAAPNPLGLIAASVAQPAFLFGFQTGMRWMHLGLPSRFRFRFERNPLGAMPIVLHWFIRLRLISKGRLFTMLAQRLLCAPGQSAGNCLQLAMCMLQRVFKFKFKPPTCAATLAGHSGSVFSAAFHPTAPIFATGSQDTTVRLWRISPDNSSATCVDFLEVHF